MKSAISYKCVFTILLLSSLPTFAASDNFRTLKHILSSRSSEPRMYLPSGVLIGKDIEITVIAPGAKSIKVLDSKEEGVINYEDQQLKLGSDYEVLGEQFTDRADFKLTLDPEHYAELETKKLYFEAIAYYEDEKTGEKYSRPVNFYGANAGTSITNAVQILATPKDNSSLAASARSFIPGLTQSPRGN